MKWVLIWATLSGNGAVATGSADFANADACLAAERVQHSLVYDAAKDRIGAVHSTQSACINTETGEKRSAFKPLP